MKHVPTLIVALCAGLFAGVGVGHYFAPTPPQTIEVEKIVYDVTAIQDLETKVQSLTVQLRAVEQERDAAKAEAATNLEGWRACYAALQRRQGSAPVYQPSYSSGRILRSR